jgi:lipopolysaccharide transport system ATP-binding protein
MSSSLRNGNGVGYSRGADTDIAVSVRGLGKSYTIQHNATRHTSAAEALMHRLRNPLARSESETFWALKDVSFDIRRGDVVGVIGRNGAGKSTLLKVLSRITEPTEGEAIVRGRLGSLLEVGTGFHPELTGRENVYLNGSILGMTRREIDREFDAIVDFSGTEKFLDTPVKRYSSGMYVRLAFAVAAHLNPEILIVDEVLAVGDAEFQKKCMGKMQDVAGQGRTVLFVSHNMAAIRGLCNRGVFMQGGKLLVDDDIEEAVAAYLANADSSTGEFLWSAENRPECAELELVAARILGSNGDVRGTLDVSEPFIITVEYRVWKPSPRLRIGFGLQNHEGIFLCGSNSLACSPDTRPGDSVTASCHFPSGVLNAGLYRVHFGADMMASPGLMNTPYCLEFHVADMVGHGVLREKLPGIIRPDLTWSVR